MGIVRIGMIVDDNKEALCYQLRHQMDGKGENQKSKWDHTPEEQKAEMCGRCPLAWNTVNCEGRFGPNYSSLPNFAKRFGCEIIAGVPKSYEERRVYSPNLAQRLLEEVRVLREKLQFEKDTVFVPKEQENLPDDKIEQWLVYTVGFDGVTTRKINALRVYSTTLDQLEKMATACVRFQCGFTFL